MSELLEVDVEAAWPEMHLYEALKENAELKEHLGALLTLCDYLMQANIGYSWSLTTARRELETLRGKQCICD